MDSVVHVHIASIDPKITAPEIEKGLLELGLVKDLRQYYHIEDQWFGDWEAMLLLRSGSRLPTLMRPVLSDVSNRGSIDETADYEVNHFSSIFFCCACTSADTRVCKCSGFAAHNGPQLDARPAAPAGELAPAPRAAIEPNRPQIQVMTPAPFPLLPQAPAPSLTPTHAPSQAAIDAIMEETLSEGSRPAAPPVAAPAVSTTPSITPTPAPLVTPIRATTKKRAVLSSSPSPSDSPIRKRQSQLFRPGNTAQAIAFRPILGASKLSRSQSLLESDESDQDDLPAPAASAPLLPALLRTPVVVIDRAPLPEVDPFTQGRATPAPQAPATSAPAARAPARRNSRSCSHSHSRATSSANQPASGTPAALEAGTSPQA
ncbi:hypothetical protein H4219_005793 [Mycoemilia scoparia]|uniref:Uncharacterized protein n=1 Tax=Mycoemilia scoparia TaxID=417184 RepID=A0A9W7ZSE4_9FUNG|nr:hypothetical protein H4219_005793 [Mycoemilia scoparia]